MGVVRCFLVSGRGPVRPVHLREQEPGGIVRLLEDIEPGDSRFPDTRAGIGQRGFLERIDAPGFHLNVDVDDEHAATIRARVDSGKRFLHRVFALARPGSRCDVVGAVKTPLTVLALAATAGLFAPVLSAQALAPRQYLNRIAPLLPPQPARPAPVAVPPAGVPAAVATNAPTKPLTERELAAKKGFDADLQKAKTNNATAQYNLGFRYLNGDGVTADDLEGRKWLQAAAKQGHAAASRTLKELGPVPVATTNRPAARAPVKP